jgi:hypothetical protein
MIDLKGLVYSESAERFIVRITLKPAQDGRKFCNFTPEIIIR